jgi:hypothetical protein
VEGQFITPKTSLLSSPHPSNSAENLRPVAWDLTDVSVEEFNDFSRQCSTCTYITTTTGAKSRYSSFGHPSL